VIPKADCFWEDVPINLAFRFRFGIGNFPSFSQLARCDRMLKDPTLFSFSPRRYWPPGWMGRASPFDLAVLHWRNLFPVALPNLNFWNVEVAPLLIVTLCFMYVSIFVAVLNSFLPSRRWWRRWQQCW